MKIIRTKVLFTYQEFYNIEDCILSKREEKSCKIIKPLNLEEKGNDNNLKMIILASYRYLNIKIQFGKEIVFQMINSIGSIEERMGTMCVKTVINKESVSLFINISKEYNSKLTYYQKVLETIYHKLYFSLQKEEDIYNEIVYYNFNDDNELLISTYCLLNLSPNMENPTFKLFKEKLYYSGYNLDDFDLYSQNKNYSSEEFEKMFKFPESKDILNYLLGYICSINKGKTIKKLNVDMLFQLCRTYFHPAF